VPLHGRKLPATSPVVAAAPSPTLATDETPRVPLVIASRAVPCQSLTHRSVWGKTAMKTARPPKGFGALTGMSLATLAILIALAVVLCPS
jgi:hypothetical protein